MNAQYLNNSYLCISHLCIGLVIALACSVVHADPLPDPTRPTTLHAAGNANAPGALHVEAIVISASGQWAVVNGIVVHSGDHIASALIETITRYAVHYSRNGHSEVALLTHSTLQVRRNNTSHEDQP